MFYRGAEIFEKVGKIVIPDDVIMNSPEGVKLISSKLIIVRAEHLIARRAVEWYAYCDEFEIANGTIEIPEYIAEITSGEDGQPKSCSFVRR